MTADLTPAKALKNWYKVNMALVHGDLPDLSTRQMAILLTIYLQVPPHTVRGLAEKLGVTKPVITRALNALGALSLVSRRRDEQDKRNVLVQRTVEGSLFLDQLAMLITQEFTQ